MYCDVGEKGSEVVIEELHITVVLQPLDEWEFHAPNGVSGREHLTLTLLHSISLRFHASLSKFGVVAVYFTFCVIAHICHLGASHHTHGIGPNPPHDLTRKCGLSFAAYRLTITSAASTTPETTP